VALNRPTLIFFHEQEALWTGALAAALSTGLAFALYVWTAAPGITWAHQGADGAELTAAAVSNGVPHPPGYPLYIWLLQGWLRFSQLFFPGSDLAWRGALLSALCAALSVGVTVVIAGHLLEQQPGRWVWATCAGLAWAISPLLWSQAVITEVYALHALFFTLLGWVILVKGGRFVYLVPVVALGVAHHLTLVLLLPAVLYYGWTSGNGTVRQLWQTMGALALGGILGLAFYLRIPLVAGGVAGPPPVNWGYADNAAGFWWLISGAAYRNYLFSAPSATLLGRIANWAYTLTSQYTVVGLGLALIGLNHWDRNKPQLRNLSLLWVVPISIYAIGYYTRDSDIYLLPVTWMVALWLATGLADAHDWLQARWPSRSMPTGLAVALAIALVVLGSVRLPALSLRHDSEARQFLDGATAVLPPNSIVISREDNDTFALWYGAWASGALARRAPGVVLINDALYQFPWYQRLITALYPDVVGNSHSVQEILALNHGVRPIFFSADLSLIPSDQLERVGPLWRYK
jgi:hypothetical protein